MHQYLLPGCRILAFLASYVGRRSSQRHTSQLVIFASYIFKSLYLEMLLWSMCVHVDVWVLFQFLAGLYGVFYQFTCSSFYVSACPVLDAEHCVFQHPTLCFVSSQLYACALFLNLFLAAYLDCLAWSACLLLPSCICIICIHSACMHFFQNPGLVVGHWGSLLPMLDAGDHSVQHPLPV